jgi:hypothetical protein
MRLEAVIVSPLEKQRNLDDMEPKIVVTKINDKLISLWDKELTRLHKTLTDPNTNEETKKFAQEQIVKLHGMIFGTGQPG